MNEMKKILEGIYNNLELRKTIAPLFISNPGMGKTKVIEEFAKEKGVELVEIITSQILPYEVSGMAIPSHSKEMMTFYDFDKINNLKDGSILFFDELLAGQPVVLSACLTLIEQRRTISGKALPNIMIVGAANPQNQLPLPPAVKERFIWYDLQFDAPSWKQYMSKYLITDEIFDQLVVLVKSESFNNSGRNFYTPRSIEKAIKMMLRDIDTPYKTKLKPILETKILNNKENDVSLGDFVWKSGESIPWIELQKIILKSNETSTK